MPSHGRRRISLLVVVIAVFGSALIPVGSAAGPVFIEDDITQDTTWTADGGPYRIVSNVSVGPDATLTIEPGTEVQIAEGISLSVAGTLHAKGAPDDQVTFTTPLTAVGPGSWGSIRTDGETTSNITLEHASIRYASIGILVDNPNTVITADNVTFADVASDAIRVPEPRGGTVISITNAEFRRIEGNGIHALRGTRETPSRISNWRVWGSEFESISGSAIELQASRISTVDVWDTRFVDVDTSVGFDTTYVRASRVADSSMTEVNRGVRVSTGRIRGVDIARNELARSGTGIEIEVRENVARLRVIDNQVTDSRVGVVLSHVPANDRFYSFDVTIAKNNLTGNAGHGLEMRTVSFSSSSITIQNNAFMNNGRSGALVSADDFSNAWIGGNRFASNNENGLSVVGRQIKSTSLRNNSARANRGDGIAIQAEQKMTGLNVSENRLLDNAGAGLRLVNGESSAGNYTVKENLVAANAYGIILDGPQTAHVVRNDLVFNSYGDGEAITEPGIDPSVGIVVAGGDDNFRLLGNDIYGNEIGLYTDTGGTVEAEGNFWGAANGPFHRSINPEGNGSLVVTNRGWVDITHAESERIGTAHSRPIARLDISPNPAVLGQEITISGEPSSSDTGSVGTYWFTIAGTEYVTSEPTRRVTYDERGSYPVSLMVEDELGIESPNPATSAIQVETPTTTSTTTTTQTTTTTKANLTTTLSTTQPPNQAQDRGFVGALFSIGGLLGAVFYLLALGFGIRGMYQTVTEQPLTVNGRRIHALAIFGIGLWGLASLFGTGGLLLVSMAGLVVWLILTALAYVIAR